jgi:hypothetical protein
VEALSLGNRADLEHECDRGRDQRQLVPAARLPHPPGRRPAGKDRLVRGASHKKNSNALTAGREDDDELLLLLGAIAAD